MECPSSLSDSKPLDDAAIARDVLPLEVIEKATTKSNHLQQATSRMVVLRVRLEVLGQVTDSFAQDRYLNLWGSGIGIMQPIRPDEVGFLILGERQ